MPADEKALFRRATAYDKNGQPKEAFQDVVKVTKMNAKNGAAMAMAGVTSIGSPAREQKSF